MNWLEALVYLEEIQPETTPYESTAPLFEDFANECEGMCGV